MRWYFDFISPYAYLQSSRLAELGAIDNVECMPVLFAGLLEHWGHTGPAELEPKRQWTFEHVTWLAHRDGVPFTLPAHHPFNPLPLLRLSQFLGNTAAVVQRIFRFVWIDGHVPQDREAFDALLAELGVAAIALEDAQVKAAIRRNTDAAIAAGVFGVPTVCHDDHNYWGYDATGMLLARASAQGDESIYPERLIAAAAKMPRGTERKLIGRSNPENLSTRASATGNASVDRVANATHATASIAPRIPYLPEDLAEPAELVAAIRKRRGGRLIELDRMLLYSPPLAQGWNHLLGTIRTGLSVSTKLREIAMCTVAVINRADYEFHHHAPLLVAAGGTARQVEALRDARNDAEAVIARSDIFDPLELAALRLSIEMTRDVQVSNETFAAIRAHLNEQELVELIATIGAYNLVSRFLVALEVHPQPEYADK